MAVHADDKRFAKKVVELKLAPRSQVEECLRIVALRADVGEPVSIEELLLERDVLSPRKLQKAQQALSLRSAFCPSCGARSNQFGAEPGARVRCAGCKTKWKLPGAGAENPCRAAPEAPREVTPDGRAAAALGLAGCLGAAALLGATAVESRGGALAVPAIACAGGAGALALAVLARRVRALTAASLALALLTGLLVAGALGHAPGARALLTLGFEPHRALPALVLVHVLVVLFAGHALAMRGRSSLPLLLLLPIGWGLVFFVWRTFAADPGVWLSGGPAVLGRLPWYAHPGVVTLLLVFPAAALLFVGGGVVGLARGEPALLLRRACVGASLALLVGFGLAVGAARGELRHPGLERRVQTAVAGRVAPWWSQARETGTVGVALTPAANAPR